ncbi:DNA sulfur modification protein DndB [Brevibacillus reuszeri]|uniref:DNA sulfur modification protein DndB n=1 Tax=Brevibacillus reuszeri TaxID=54915 RepID=UPI003D24EF48
MERKEMKFLTTEVDFVVKRVSKMINLFETGQLIIDPEAQRKLAKAHMKEIATYLRNALDGKTYGAYFPALTASRRSDGIEAILDGQHRFFGVWEALKQIKKEITVLEKALEKSGAITLSSIIMEIQDPNSETIAKGVRKMPYLFQQLQEAVGLVYEDDHMQTGVSEEVIEKALKHLLDKLKDHEAIILESVVPMVVYVGLSKKQEQQAFHDFNQKGKKVAKALAISFNHSDPMVNVAQLVCQFDSVKQYVQPFNEGTKLKGDYLFLFSTIYTTVSTFFGVTKNKPTEKTEDMISEIEDFFTIVMNSISDEIPAGSLLKHAGTLPGLALFAKRMKDTNTVSWRNTLTNALVTIPLLDNNTQFVRFGRAAVNPDQTVRFSGSNGAISAVVKTFESMATLLDENGVELLTAYETLSKQEPVPIVSEQEAELKQEEVLELQEEITEESVDERTNDDGMSASEKAIIQAIQESDERVLRGSYTTIGKDLRFARSSITEAIKKLEKKGVIFIRQENEQKILTLRNA